jgi:glycosyltransferase involved in cell wall biosynthesis
MGIKKNPRISIGLPVYNGEKFLEQTLDSILAQTFEDYELVISDNASTDRTEEICRTYANQDKRISYYRNPENRGAAWNYNRVFALSSGKYFKWAAHDDICAPRLLERCIEVFDNNPSSVVLCYPRSSMIDENGSVLWEHWLDLNIEEDKPHQRLSHLIRNLDGLPNPIFGLIRSSSLSKTRGHGTYLSADYVLLAELALLGEFREVPEFLFYNRLHKGSSREANPKERDAADWFLPDSGKGIIMEYWTVFIQHLISIKLSPIDSVEKLRCYYKFAPAWLWIWRDPLARELLNLPNQVLASLLSTRKGSDD